MQRARVCATANGQWESSGKMMAFRRDWDVPRIAARALQKLGALDHAGKPASGSVEAGCVVHVLVLSGECKGQYVAADVNEVRSDGKVDLTIRETDLAKRAGVNGVRVEECERKFIRESDGPAVDVWDGIPNRLFRASDGVPVTDAASLEADAKVVASRGEQHISRVLRDSHTRKTFRLAEATCRLVIPDAQCQGFRYERGKPISEWGAAVRGPFELLEVQPSGDGKKDSPPERRLTVRVGTDLTLVLKQKMPIVRAEEGDRLRFVFARRKVFTLSGEIGIYVVELPAAPRLAVRSAWAAAVDVLAAQYSERFIAAKDAATDRAIKVAVEALPDRVADAGNSIAALMERGSERAASGLRSAARATGSALKRGSSFLKTKIKPKAKAIVVSPEAKTRMRGARAFAGGAAKVSQALAAGVKTTAGMISKEIAKVAETSKLGRKVAERADSKRLAAAKNVTLSAVGSASNVWEALLEAGASVISDLSEATGDVLAHRYGEQVGDMAREGAEVVKSLTESAKNMSKVGVGAVAKTVVKQSTVELCTEASGREAKEAAPVDLAMMASVLAAAGSSQAESKAD